MRSTPVQRGSSLIVTISMIVMAIVVGTAVTLISLWAMGVELPFFAKREVPTPDGVPIPLSGQKVPAFTRLNRDHFRIPQTGERALAYRSAEDIERLGIIVDESKLMNRVLAHDIPPGFAIREKDLLPKDTRAGEVGGIPPGKRLFVLAADKVQGIHGLRLGDQFDLLASVAVDVKAQSKSLAPGAADVFAQGEAKHAKVRAIVQNGTIVVPITIRDIPTGAPSNAKTGKVPTKPLQEIKIAIDPSEVAPLHEALAVQATLVCVARSGRPEEATIKSATPGSASPPPIHNMEVIAGSKRQTLIFPVPDKGPEEMPMPGSSSLAESKK